MLISLQKQQTFQSFSGQWRRTPPFSLIEYAPTVVTELRNVRFQNKVWLRLKIVWQLFENCLTLTSYTHLFWYMVFRTTTFRNLLWNSLSANKFYGWVHCLYLLFFCFALIPGENYVELLHMNWIRTKEKLNTEILTPLKRSTNKTLKNYWFLSNLVKNITYILLAFQKTSFYGTVNLFSLRLLVLIKIVYY